MHDLILRHVCHDTQPLGSGVEGGLGLLCSYYLVVLLLGEERDNMWVDLGNDEVVNVEHLCKSGHWQIVVNGSVNPLLRRWIPWGCSASIRILG